MAELSPVDPRKRIEILDILRGFALLGIIFNNMLYFSAYEYMPFEKLEQMPNFHLDEKFHTLLDIIITGKFYALFSILFAVGFYIQFNKYKIEPKIFLKTYRRRIFFLLIIGLVHSLIWYGDILFTYAIIAFILILFRNVKTVRLFRWSLFFLLLPVLIDLVLFPFTQNLNPINSSETETLAHIQYPDMAPERVVELSQDGTIAEIFSLNIHNIAWKYFSYVGSGRLFIILGIFLLGYYLASNEFFTRRTKLTSLMVSSLIIGCCTTITAKLLGGSFLQFPPSLPNILYKFLSTTGQIFLCLFYITLIFKIYQASAAKKVFRFLIPMGRMALSNYLFQTMLMTILFYSFGFDLIGKVSLVSTAGIAILVLVLQIIISNIWVRYFKFGPFEWMWRSLTYKKRIRIRLDNS